MTHRLLFCLFLCVVITSFAFAGNTGKISGKVIDAKTREPLVGVNVIVSGTAFGASTNIDGQFNILNLPPATYSIKATLLGYNTVTVNNIRVSIDLTTQQDFELGETVLEQKEVVITAERPLVQKDLTAKTAVVGKDEIAALPVTEVSQVLSLQAGFVGGNLRGGRSSEVAYWIDGVPVTDAFNGTQVVEINKNQVQEMQLVSGAFNAEYGQAMSGIVNIATKEGGSKINGTFSTYVGQYATGTGKQVVAGGTDSSELYPGITSRKFPAIRNFEGSISGPLIGDNLTFFGSGRYIYFDGWEMGELRYHPWYYPVTGNGIGDGSVIPMNWSERSYAQGKLTWKMLATLKLNADYIYDFTRSMGYDRMFSYDPQGKGIDRNKSHTVITQLTHTLSNTTYYTLGMSYFRKNVHYGLYDLQFRPATSDDVRAGLADPGDMIQVDGPGPYVHPDRLSANANNFYSAGTDNNISDRTTQTYLAKLDLASQIDQSNMVKFGVEFRQHKIDYDNYTVRPTANEGSVDWSLPYAPYIRGRIQPVSTPYHDTYNHSPKEFSTYLQDKMEFKDFILNIGLRFDYFQPDAFVLNDAHPDPTDPEHYMYTVDDPDIYSPLRAEHKTDDIAKRMSYWYKRASAKHQFSPRIGASFPITAGGVVHFSYGHFFQTPRFELLYSNPAFKISETAGDNSSLLGNADLNPEQTVTGEIGIQQQLSEDIAFDLTTYMRDIRGLSGTRGAEVEIFGNSQSYTQYINSDFGLVKGIVLSLNKKFSKGLAATLDYTFQIADGTASDPAEARNASLAKSLPEVHMIALAWDQRHTLNVTTSYNAPNWGLSFIGQYGSGKPYTPRVNADITSLGTNSEIKPTFFNLDMRAFYNVTLESTKLVFFLRVFNLLDIRNQVNVFDDTGDAAFTTDEDRLRTSASKNTVTTLDQWFRDASHYSEPRRIEFGMNLEF